MEKKKKKLKIVFVTNNYKPYSGGVVSSIDSFRTALEVQGNRIKIVTLDFTGEPEHDPDVIRIACPVKFVYRSNPMAIPLQMNKQLCTFLKLYQPDIVHVHHPFLLGVAATRIAKEKKIPVVFTHHSQYGMYARCYAPFFKNFADQLTTEYVKQFCLKVDTIIVPTQSIERQLKQQHITTSMSVIPSGIDSCFIHSICPKKRTTKKIKLLTVARFRSEKNLLVLFDVLKKVSVPFEFTLIGYGDQEQALKEYAYQTCGLSRQQVKFVIAPLKEIIVQAYKKADLFLFASKTETQGIVFAESMAVATPVIAFDAPGARDIVQHGENGFLVKTNKEMADVIQMLVQDQKLYDNCSQHAFMTAQKYHSKFLGDKLVKLYQQTLLLTDGENGRLSDIKNKKYIRDNYGSF